MEPQERELLVARICSGTIRIKIKGETCLLKHHTLDDAYIGNEIYQETLKEAHFEGVFTDDEIYELMMETGLWDDNKDSLLKKLPKEIEEFKVKLFQATFKSNEKKTIRKALEIAKAKLNELFAIRHQYDSFSCLGLAAISRTRYLVYRSVFRLDGTPFFSANFPDSTNEHVDEAMQLYGLNKLSETAYRELSHTEPWRAIWTCKKSEAGVFGIPASLYSEEQRNLVCWSGLYDGIYQHPQCPTDEIIDDDDMLDGWMIVQRRARETALNKSSSEDLISNEKIKGSSEIFLVAETEEDAAKINDLNDDRAKYVKKQRMSKLQKEGQVNELDMPDTRQRLIMEITNKLSGSMAAAKG